MRVIRPIRSCPCILSAVFILLSGVAKAADETAPSNPILLRIVVGQTLLPEDENQMAEADGFVTFVGGHGAAMELELSSGDGHMPVSVSKADDDLAPLLLRSRIRVQGVCRGIRNSMNGELIGSLSVRGMDDVTLLQVAEETWQRYPTQTIAAWLRAEPSGSAGGIVHLLARVRGAQSGNSVRVSDATGEIAVRSVQQLPKEAGTEVEMLGRIETGTSGPIFNCAVFRVINKGKRRISSLPVLTTTEQVRWLKPEEASRAYPVRVRVVVTFVLDSDNEAAGNLQDGTGGIYAWHLTQSVHAGDYCEVEGETSAGEFSPGIDCRRVTVLGRGQFPEPVRPTWRELASGGLDAQWVEVEGVILSVTNQHLEIGSQGGRIPCFISGSNSLERLLDGVVRLRGVVVADRDQSRHVQGIHLNVPSEEFVSLEAAPAGDPFSLPPKQVKDLLFYDPGESVFRREKVSGQIVGVRDSICYLMSGTNGLRFITKDSPPLTPGDVVEAVGFPEIDNSAETPLITLREAIVRVNGTKPLPPPVKIRAAELFSGQHDSTLVQLEARIVHLGMYEVEQVLELQVGARTFFARLNTSRGRIPQHPPGSLVLITGVNVSRSGKANGPVDAGSVELLLNSPADLRVLELPSWWTGTHALIVVSTMASVILLTLVWIALLRRQVEKRTKQLQREIHEREQAERHHAIEKERTRIARDIHDELGCNLSEIRLLSEMTLSQNRAPSEIQFNANKISAKALETTRVLDEIVWAVDPKNDTLESLLNYLFTFASDYLSLAGIRFRIDAPTKIPHHALTTQVRHQLYMTVKETLTNIVNHAKATEVSMRLQLDNGAALIMIEDNGRGFAAAEPNGDAAVSGLNNMRKRFSDIGGEFILDSVPERGTRVGFKLPLDGAKLE